MSIFNLLKKFHFGTPYDDTINGSDRNDIIFGFGGDDDIFAGKGNDLVFGGRGNDHIEGGKGNDTLLGNRGNDVILGGDGNDDIFGDRGNDGLRGDAGNDSIAGGLGNDLVIGGAGNDDLWGDAGVNTFLFRPGFGKDTVHDFSSHDLLDLNGLGFANGAAAKAAMVQQGHDVVLKVGADKLVLEDTHLADISAAQIITSDQTKGPSSSQSPYLLSKEPGKVEITSILTTGDSVGGYKMAGIPDGLGAFDNGDGTFTVLMNHEIASGLGAVRDHGAKGAFVSEWVIDKTTLQVVSGHDLIQHVWLYDPVAHNYVLHDAAHGNGVEFSRFCSADLADATAFYNPLTGLGFNGGRLFLDGEETGNEGRPMAHIASGADAGNSYELAWLGNMAYENLVANAHTGDKTVVGMMDDTSPIGQVYFYFGDKQSTGNAVEKAGLTGGHMFGIHVNDFGAGSTSDAPNSTTPLGADGESDFSLVDLGDVSGMTGAQIQAASEAAGASEFRRPEDGAWDTINPNRFYFVTTNAFNTDDTHPTNPTQLWAVDFVDATRPDLGGKIKLLVQGDEKVGGVSPNMFDNITVNDQGHVILCEDVGNQAHLGKVWDYDPVSDTLTVMAEHDPSRFLTGGSQFLTQDEEASGVIDISDILGNAGENVYLIDTQAHNASSDPALVEGGQLQLIRDLLLV